MTINMELKQQELTGLKPTIDDNKHGFTTTGTNL